MPNSTSASINTVYIPFVTTLVFVSTHIPNTASTTPIATPYTICAKIAYGTVERFSPFTREIPTTVSIYAVGSLLPLSISSREATPSFKFSFFFRKMENTLAASVQEMTAPKRNPSAKRNFNTTQQNAIVRNPVRNTPAVDNNNDLTATGFAAFHLVLKPP